MRTRLHYRKGTNQYGIKPRLRAVALMFIPAVTLYLGYRYIKHLWKQTLGFFLFFLILSNLSMNAYAPRPVQAYDHPYSEYQIPTLNPNLTEREQNISLIKKIWGNDAETGLNIARCESGYRTHALNKNSNMTIDQGVFQINSVHGMPEMENAVANILYAYKMYQEQGTNPWTSSEKCWRNL